MQCKELLSLSQEGEPYFSLSENEYHSEQACGKANVGQAPFLHPKQVQVQVHATVCRVCVPGGGSMGGVDRNG